MATMETILKKTTVKVMVGKKYQSGTFFKITEYPEYIFLTTSWHGIYGNNIHNKDSVLQSDITIHYKIEKDTVNVPSCNAKNAILEEDAENDIIVLIFDKAELSKQLGKRTLSFEPFKICKLNDIPFDAPCRFRGYPKAFEGEKYDTFKANFQARDPYKKTLEFTIDDSLYDYDKEPHELLQGISGSGIFTEIEGDIQFVGIVKRGKNKQFSFKRAEGVSIEVILDKVYDKLYQIKQEKLEEEFSKLVVKNICSQEFADLKVVFDKALKEDNFQKAEQKLHEIKIYHREAKNEINGIQLTQFQIPDSQTNALEQEQNEINFLDDFFSLLNLSATTDYTKGNRAISDNLVKKLRGNDNIDTILAGDKIKEVIDAIDTKIGKGEAIQKAQKEIKNKRLKQALSKAKIKFRKILFSLLVISVFVVIYKYEKYADNEEDKQYQKYIKLAEIYSDDSIYAYQFAIQCYEQAYQVKPENSDKNLLKNLKDKYEQLVKNQIDSIKNPNYGYLTFRFINLTQNKKRRIFYIKNSKTTRFGCIETNKDNGNIEMITPAIFDKMEFNNEKKPVGMLKINNKEYKFEVDTNGNYLNYWEVDLK